MTSIYIHIGTPKTASTYIQKNLYSNRASLIDQGGGYPQAGAYDNEDKHLLLNHAVACQGLYSSYRPEKFKSLKKAELGSSLFLRKNGAQLRNESGKSQAKKVILSSENFWKLDSRQVHILKKLYQLLKSRKSLYTYADKTSFSSIGQQTFLQKKILGSTKKTLLIQSME